MGRQHFHPMNIDKAIPVTLFATSQSTNYTATCLPSQKPFKLDEPDMQNTAGEAGTSSEVMYSYGPPYMAEQKHVDQLEHIYSSYVRIRDIALKTCQKRWTIGKSGERGSGISVIAARHDDDDDDDILSLSFNYAFSVIRYFTTFSSTSTHLYVTFLD